MIPFKQERLNLGEKQEGGIIGFLATEAKLKVKSKDKIEAPKWGFSVQQKAKVLLAMKAKANPWK